MESVLVDRHAFVRAHLDRKIKREAESIIEFEGVGTGKDSFILLLVIIQQIFENRHTGINGAVEVLFFVADYRDDIVLFFTQLRILAFIFMDNRVNNLPEKCIIHIKQLAMACSTTHQAAQHIASAFIGWQDPVTDHKDGGTNMVRNDAERNICFMISSVIGTGKFAHLVGDIHHRINIEERIDILADTGKTFQAHAGIDIFLFELSIIVVAVIIELGKHVVPDLNIPITVTAHSTGRFSAAEFLSTVIINLRAWTTWACSMFPEVIFLSETEDPFRCYSNLFIPDVKRFIVILENRRIQAIRF